MKNEYSDPEMEQAVNRAGTMLESNINKLREKALLDARRGGFFHKALAEQELDSWRELEYEALAALEERIEALERHTGTAPATPPEPVLSDGLLKQRIR